VGLVTLVSTAIAKPALRVRGDTPQYFVDPSTTQYCTWYHDNADGAITCNDVPGAYGASWEDFLRWVCTVLSLRIEEPDIGPWTYAQRL
jgi:hypothetical protein